MVLDINPSNVIPFPIARVDRLITRPKLQDQTGFIGPIEREMRAKLAKLEACKYPDTFDWSVYDRIAGRFDEPPRGGTVFKTTFKLVNHHSSCSKCLYAFEIDTYGRGCIHDCKYCYAKEQLTTYGYWNRPSPMPVDMAQIRREFYLAFETDKASKWRPILSKKVPLRIGSMSDSFMWLDTKYGVTKELLKILRFYQYPYVVFTRSDLISHDDYIELLDQKLAAIQFSISGNRPNMRKIEPGAPSFSRRIKAISRLVDHGIWTGVRLNPLFPRYPDGYFTDPSYIRERFGTKTSVPTLDLWDDEMVAQIAESGVKSALAGFARLSHRAISHIGKELSLDLRPFFKPENVGGRGSAESKYCDSEIGYYYTYLSREFKKHDIRFSTCYIGNGIKDYYQYQHLWANKSDCCDISGNVPTFTTSCQSVDWKTRMAYSTDPEKTIQAESMERQADKNLSNHAADSSSPLDL